MKYLLSRIDFSPLFFRISIGSFFTLLFFYILALKLNWFFHYPSIDIPMHVTGGFLAGIIALTLFPKNISPFQKLIWVTFWVLVAGIGVEIIEWLFDHYGNLLIPLQSSAIDTYTDILHDMIGGMGAFLLGYWKDRV